MEPSLFRADTAFFPPIARPRASGHLRVAPPHEIWWEETGPEDGWPVLILHGGPGGRIKPYYRRLIDPRRWRGIFFDQRGCGNSRPFGELEGNDTGSLVADMEALRQSRGVERWTVVGGSWGSSLALAYAEAHPGRVAGLVLSGVFLCRPEDIDWSWQGARRIFPEVYAARDAFLPPAERADPRAAFRRRILDPDPRVHKPAAAVLGHAESQTLDLLAPSPPDDPEALDEEAAAYARIMAWYDAHDFFLAENQLLERAGALAPISGAIVAGRSDMCTPPKGAWDLARVWPQARLTFAPAAGHRWNDEALGRVLVAEIDRIASLASAG
ncbi:MAG TPA: alpha/beta fold hydrolase [Caulobacteraceae bacterium]|nr:alpha/beta fold hydrolase [Caulobacteraceae bacterium]